MTVKDVPLALAGPTAGLFDPRRIFAELATNLTNDERAFFLAAIEEPDNGLYIDFIEPRLLVAGAYYTYTAPSTDEDEQEKAWNPTYTQAALKYGPRTAQLGFGIFTNPLRWPSRDAAAGRWTGRPSERATNAGYCVYTFEVDHLASGTRADLIHEMIDRVRGGAIEKLDRNLKQFFDYRGSVIVYSGGKSFHIHLVFDLRHLRRDLAFVGNSKYKQRWTCDVPDEYLRGAYKEYFHRLRPEFDQAMAGGLEIDTNLERWEQPRRCPYGLRDVDKDHPLGLPTTIDGEPLRIPQLVVQSRLSLKAPYGATAALHQAEEMIEIGQRYRTTASSRTYSSISRPKLDLVSADGSDPVATIFEQMLPEGMKYAGTDRSGPDVRFFFRNGPSDATPSSVMRREHDAILLQGMHEFGTPVLDLGVSADQIERDCRDMPKPVPREHRHWLEKEFQEYATTPQRAREFLGCIPKIVEKHRRILVKAPEGIGKSAAFLRGMDRLASLGDVVFACPSYAQAQEKLDEFNRYWSGKGLKGFLMKSVSRLYADTAAALEVDPIGRTEALDLGYESWLRCVAEHQPEVFSAMLAYREGLFRIRQGGERVVLFTAHAVVRLFRHAPSSWAFHHREFEETWREGKAEGMHELAQRARPGLVIYDELTPKDLVYMHRRDDVEWVNRCRGSLEGWESHSLMDRYAAYKTHATTNPRVTWDAFQEIAAMGYRDDDAIPVDTSRELPFDDQKGMYAKTRGDLVYLKPREWWTEFPHVVLLTTEQLPTEIVRGLDAKAAEKCTDDGFQILEFDLPERNGVVFLETNHLCKKKTLPRLEAYYRRRNPEIQVISDMMSDPDVRTHYAAKGRNDISDRDIAAFYTALDPQQYRELAAINAYFDLRCAVRLVYADRVNQTSGRNCGFRGGNGKEHVAVMSVRLRRWLRPFLLRFSRYDIVDRKPPETEADAASPDGERHYTPFGMSRFERKNGGHPERDKREDVAEDVA